MLAIFLNNKVIACDTVMPAMMEIARRNPRQAINFYVFEMRTYDALKRNIVLWDAINTIGQLRMVGRRSRHPLETVRQRLHMGALMLGLLVLAWCGRATLIHFKAFEEWPLRLLYVLAPWRTVRWEADAASQAGLPGYMEVCYLGRGPERRPVHAGRPSAGAFVCYGEDCWDLDDPVFRTLPRAVLPRCLVTEAWANFIAARADDYFSREFERAGVGPTDEILAVIGVAFGTPFAYLEDDSAHVVRWLAETLDVLVEEGGNRPIFYKPAFWLKTSPVDEALARVPRDRLVITNLHPAVLCMRARLVTTPIYSTTFSVAKRLGVPTVEYAEYSDDALAMTGGRPYVPRFVDHFIRADRAVLASTVRQVLAGPRPLPQLSADSLSPAAEGLFCALAKGVSVGSALTEVHMPSRQATQTS